MKNVFEYLVHRIMNKRCVPLIGAGISQNATKSGLPWNGHGIGSMIDKVLVCLVKKRVERLAPQDGVGGHSVALCSECNSAFETYGKALSHLSVSTTDAGWCALCDIFYAKKDKHLTKICESFLWEYEGPNQPKAYERLVEILEIKEFAKLDPTPAHFYLAFLAREGLITEFVTTNYDCNLELAYEASWGVIVDNQNIEINAICDLKSFVSGAAKSGEWQPGADTPHPLKVYKINGCAQRLAETPTHAVDILLTASQLQDWRKRRWAADYFRTKVRSASLVTIGFGSDEPQVVHTLQQVLEEFSGTEKEGKGIETATATAADLFNRDNAPVVSTYDPYPSFQQRQLVCGFSSWLTGNSTLGEQLVIGPLQRSLHGQTRTKLPADVLWKDIFQVVFARLLERRLSRAAMSANAAFTAVVPYADSILKSLACEVENNLQSQMEPTTAPLHWLAYSENIPESAVALPRIVRLMNHLCAHPGNHRYTAISDHGTHYAELALLLELVRSGLDSLTKRSVASIDNSFSFWNLVALKAGAAIEIRVPSWKDDASEDPATSLLVTRRNTTGFQQKILVSGPNLASKRLELVLGSRLRHNDELERRCYFEDAKTQTRTSVTFVRLDWQALFTQGNPPVFNRGQK